MRPGELRGSEEFVDLYQMVEGDGPFKDVCPLREEKKADIVGLVVDDPRGCGSSTALRRMPRTPTSSCTTPAPR
jgi:hypothetical protein